MKWVPTAASSVEVLPSRKGAVLELTVVTSREELADLVTRAARIADLTACQAWSGAQMLVNLVSRPAQRILLLDMDSIEPSTVRLAVDAVCRLGAHSFHVLFLAKERQATETLPAADLPCGSYDIVDEPVRQGELTALLARAAARLQTQSAQGKPDDTAQLIANAVRNAKDLITSVEALRSLTDTATGPGSQQRSPLDHVGAVIRARRARERLFGPELFADPAWDMLLDLFAHHLRGQMITVSSLCIAAVVPQTTALRRLDEMIKVKLVVKERDPTDGRRMFVRLSDEAAEKMHMLLRQYGLLS